MNISEDNICLSAVTQPCQDLNSSGSNSSTQQSRTENFSLLFLQTLCFILASFLCWRPCHHVTTEKLAHRFHSSRLVQTSPSHAVYWRDLNHMETHPSKESWEICLALSSVEIEEQKHVSGYHILPLSVQLPLQTLGKYSSQVANDFLKVTLMKVAESDPKPTLSSWSAPCSDDLLRSWVYCLSALETPKKGQNYTCLP